MYTCCKAGKEKRAGSHEKYLNNDLSKSIIFPQCLHPGPILCSHVQSITTKYQLEISCWRWDGTRQEESVYLSIWKEFLVRLNWNVQVTNQPTNNFAINCLVTLYWGGGGFIGSYLFTDSGLSVLWFYFILQQKNIFFLYMWSMKEHTRTKSNTRIGICSVLKRIAWERRQWKNSIEKICLWTSGIPCALTLSMSLAKE